MARGRMINTTIALDPEFNAMSMEAQMLFLRTVPHLDRDGLVIGQPSALWATVAPLLPALMATMQSAIDEWVQAGLVEVLPTKIGPVLYFSSFHTNQIGMRYDRESPSRLPLPEGYERTPDGLRQVSGNLPSSIRQDDGKLPHEVEVEREVEREGEGERKESAAPVQKYIQPPNPPLSFRPEHKHATSYMEEAKALGIGPEPFRLMVDEVLDATGKRHKADAERNDLTLNQAKDAVIQVAKMGYVCVQDIQRIIHSWTKNDWRGETAPTFGQVVDHASAMKTGKHVTRKQTAQAGVDAEKAAIKETSKRIQMEAQRTAQKFNNVQEVPDGTPPF